MMLYDMSWTYVSTQQVKDAVFSLNDTYKHVWNRSDNLDLVTALRLRENRKN